MGIQLQGRDNRARLQRTSNLCRSISKASMFTLCLFSSQPLFADTQIIVEGDLLKLLPIDLPQIEAFQALASAQEGNLISVKQDGSHLNVQALQQGRHNVSIITQSGVNDGRVGIDTKQIGTGNVQVVTQQGLESEIYGGMDLSATLYQQGEGNGLWLEQTGNNLNADIAQYGNDNMAYAYQTGYGHSVDIYQFGNSNLAYVNQSGAVGHHAEINQVGDDNLAIIFQSGDIPMSEVIVQQEGSDMSLQMLRFAR
ncbi:hypothetical protein FS418_10965 [Shewanella sp. YLB-09]|nr:hypothetical protein [Shewanella sp. YLB-09]QFU22348.1 hypothetical protein FS418_10965 [Shewanella sp. YLB-09]